MQNNRVGAAQYEIDLEISACRRAKPSQAQRKPETQMPAAPGNRAHPYKKKASCQECVDRYTSRFHHAFRARFYRNKDFRIRMEQRRRTSQPVRRSSRWEMAKAIETVAQILQTDHGSL